MVAFLWFPCRSSISHDSIHWKMIGHLSRTRDIIPEECELTRDTRLDDFHSSSTDMVVLTREIRAILVEFGAERCFFLYVSSKAELRKMRSNFLSREIEVSTEDESLVFLHHPRARERREFSLWFLRGRNRVESSDSQRHAIDIEINQEWFPVDIRFDIREKSRGFALGSRHGGLPQNTDALTAIPRRGFRDDVVPFAPLPIQTICEFRDSASASFGSRNFENDEDVRIPRNLSHRVDGLLTLRITEVASVPVSDDSFVRRWSLRNDTIRLSRLSRTCELDLSRAPSSIPVATECERNEDDGDDKHPKTLIFYVFVWHEKPPLNRNGWNGKILWLSLSSMFIRKRNSKSRKSSSDSLTFQ